MTVCDLVCSIVCSVNANEQNITNQDHECNNLLVASLQCKRLKEIEIGASWRVTLYYLWSFGWHDSSIIGYCTCNSANISAPCQL